MAESLDKLFAMLWNDYSVMNKQAEKIHQGLEARGERVVNDHIAFRTFDLPGIEIEAFAAHFTNLGYRLVGDNYDFKEKKLIAKHYEHVNPSNPKIFVSALKIKDCSSRVREILQDLASQIPADLTRDPAFLISGVPWRRVKWETYQELLKESEYAAWMSAFGFRVNHFTVFFNALKGFKDLQALNTFIKGLGFKLNEAGGEVKGSKTVYLEQSSTLAYPVKVSFLDREEMAPGCYYEFARRYVMPDGKIFQGFLPDSADKLFESTNVSAGKTK